MIVEKKLAYDWAGANEWLFHEINKLDGIPAYNSLMVFLSAIADHHNFIYYFIAIAIYGAIDCISRRLSKRVGGGQTLVMWIGILSVFAAAYFLDGYIVTQLKDNFAYPRPYVALDGVHMLGAGKDGDDHHNFPSGHASFITVLVCSLWPALVGKKSQFGALLIFAVCWSRIAMGMHFPADVAGGFLISFFVVLVVRKVIYGVYSKIFGWKC